MKQLEFTTLRLFVAVAETGSLSAAAERSNIAIAAVSKRIADLESSVGSQFFYRHARGMQLTPAGRELLQHAQDILFSVDRMVNNLSHYAQGIKGHVRVAATSSAVSLFLPEEIKRFGDLHPNIVIDLQEWTSDRITDVVDEGRVDMGIFIGPSRHESLVTFPYRVDRLCVVAPVGHPLTAHAAVRLVDVLPYDFIGLEPRSSIGQRVSAAGGMSLKVRINVRSTDALCRMVAAGLGVGVAPMLVAEAHQRSMGVSLIDLDEPWAERRILIGVRSEEGLSVPARLFLASCREGARQAVGGTTPTA